MNLRTRSTLVVLIAALVLTGAAQASETFKDVLPNGMTVIIRENHSSPVVNLRFYVKSGSLYEGKWLGCGISHFCEHLQSDGTTNRTLEQFEKEVEAIGGGYNAYTTKDHICFFVETSSEHFDKALELLADMAMNWTYPEEAVEAQHGVITREINMGYDEPGRRLYNLFNEVMFRVHPVKYPTIGYVENFQRLTREDVVEYASQVFVPNNMVFVAVGDLDTEETYRKIAEVFRDFERKPYEKPALPSEPPQLGRRELREERDLDMAYVRMGFHTVPLSHPDLYPLDVLSYVLSNGKSSRLYRKLVEELGLVYSVSTYSHTPAYDAGVFGIAMRMDPANVDAAIDAVLEELYKLKREKVGKAELAKAKKQKASEFYFGRQDMESLASSLGTSEISSGNPDFDELYVDHIQEVTADEIREVARKYFYDDNLGIAILEPKPEAAEGEATATKAELAVEIGPVEKYVLDNGLTVLIKENHTNPVVSVASFSLAGARFEEKPGVANFVASMMPRGTRRRSGAQIAAEFDALGVDYTCRANHTRIQSSMTVLSDDLKRSFDLFSDILMNPRFDSAEMEKQRPLIEAAIMARADDWATDAMDRMLAELFPTHPYGRSPVGTKESLADITREDLIAHHSSLLTPENTVITVFGDVDSDAALGLVQRKLGKWTATGEARAAIIVEPEGVEGKTVTSYHDRAQTVIYRGYMGMPYSSEDRYAMDVLDAVMSGVYYPGGWLHSDLRGKGLVYVVHAYNWTGYDAGYFGIYAATYDEALEEALKIIDGYVEKAATELISDDELEQAKRLCIIMEETSEQTNADQARDAAIPELYGLGYSYNDDYAAKIRSVTKEDVLRVAGKYLHDPVTVVRRPRPEGESEQAALE